MKPWKRYRNIFRSGPFWNELDTKGEVGAIGLLRLENSVALG